MRRREFITLLGGAVAVLPLAARAQPGNLPTIVVLGDRASAWNSWDPAFVTELRELGWIDGRTIAIEYRWSEGQPERVAESAAELLGRKVDVIVTYGGAAVILKQAKVSIPIVFALASDPLGVGLVPSLSHPDGNITGLSVQQSESASKRLELLREVVPSLHRLAIVFDGGYPGAVREMGAVEIAARALGLDVAQSATRGVEDFGPAIQALQGHADALYVVETALTSGPEIPTRALQAKLPTTFATTGAARAGGLMSYGANIPALFQRATKIVDKILRGTKPGDIPVEQPTKFDLVIQSEDREGARLSRPATYSCSPTR